MQLIYTCFILLFTYNFFVELKTSMNATDPPNILNFFKAGWNVMDFLILTLAYVFAILLLLYQSNPEAQAFDMEVKHFVDMFPVAE